VRNLGAENPAVPPKNSRADPLQLQKGTRDTVKSWKQSRAPLKQSVPAVRKGAVLLFDRTLGVSDHLPECEHARSPVPTDQHSAVAEDVNPMLSLLIRFCQVRWPDVRSGRPPRRARVLTKLAEHQRRLIPPVQGLYHVYHDDLAARVVHHCATLEWRGCFIAGLTGCIQRDICEVGVKSSGCR